MSENGPAVGVVMLCYNHAQFVEEAITGLLGQTYAPLEIIIVDDCSSDDTAKIIAACLSKGQRDGVRFVRNPENLGGWQSCISGLEMTTGRFISVVSGDDVMLPEMINEMAEVWRGEDVSLVTTNAIYIDERSNPLNRTFRDPNVDADDSFETLARDGSNACCFGPAIGFERAIYETFGWPPAYLNCYDIMLPFYAYLLKGARFISTPLVKYRVHRDNTSLSLQAERTSTLQRSFLEERMLIGHIAHATLMEEELDRLQNQEPERYRPVAQRIMPLLTIQQSEMAKKLARLSRETGTLAAAQTRWPAF